MQRPGWVAVFRLRDMTAIVIQMEEFVRAQPRDQRARGGMDLARAASFDPIVDAAAKLPPLGGEYPLIPVEQDEARDGYAVHRLFLCPFRPAVRSWNPDHSSERFGAAPRRPIL